MSESRARYDQLSGLVPAGISPRIVAWKVLSLLIAVASFPSVLSESGAEPTRSLRSEPRARFDQLSGIVPAGIRFLNVVNALLSSFNAAANSLSVLSASGALSTRSLKSDFNAM